MKKKGAFMMIEQKEMMDLQRRRAAWKKCLLLLAANGDFAGVLCGMADNMGDKGDIKSLIENFCENADPLEGAEKRGWQD